jgi:hypothetical protein
MPFVVFVWAIARGKRARRGAMRCMMGNRSWSDLILCGSLIGTKYIPVWSTYIFIAVCFAVI